MQEASCGAQKGGATRLRGGWTMALLLPNPVVFMDRHTQGEPESPCRHPGDSCQIVPTCRQRSPRICLPTCFSPAGASGLGGRLEPVCGGEGGMQCSVNPCHWVLSKRSRKAKGSWLSRCL